MAVDFVVDVELHPLKVMEYIIQAVLGELSESTIFRGAWYTSQWDWHTDMHSFHSRGEEGNL